VSGKGDSSILITYHIFSNAVTIPAKAEEKWSVDYGKVTPLLVKAIQEQQANIQKLQTTIEAQQKQIDELKKMVEMMMKKIGLAKAE